MSSFDADDVHFERVSVVVRAEVRALFRDERAKEHLVRRSVRFGLPGFTGRAFRLSRTYFFGRGRVCMTYLAPIHALASAGFGWRRASSADFVSSNRF